MHTQTERHLDRAIAPDLFEQDEYPDPDHSCEPLTPEEADEIFRLAEAELQPMLEQLRRWRRKDLMYGLAEFLCFCIFLFSLGGIVWQCITYPHTLVVLYTKAIPFSTTATLALPTRTLAPVTLTRSATKATTGTGHQDAARATGTLTFYNGLSTVQTVQATVLTGRDGVQVTVARPVAIPAATPPQFGETSVPVAATNPGAAGNIAAYDVSLALSSSLTVKNLSAFTGGRDARTFTAVAAKDIAVVTATVNGTVTRAFPTAFPLRPGEAAITTHCTTTTTPDHQAGEEAQSVTLTISKTCAAVAYSQRELTRAATAAFTKTRPGVSYHIVGDVQTTFQNVSPVTVTLSGKWAFTFSQSYQDSLAEQIQGDTPAKARAYLLKTGVISYASIPNTLASADYINFFVLVG